MAAHSMHGEPGVPDFVLMSEISEEAFMKNLTDRYHGDIIYSYIGEVVVSVNPYKPMETMFNEAKMKGYRNRFMFEVPPHVFSLANETYSNLISDKEDQCVIISGESGAGKTEASKILMNYIAFVSKSSTEVDRVKNQLLDSNPILEAFGNAKTLRNDNSSRFGKYMELQFAPDGRPIGGRITNYLLEKGRVVTRAKGERAFHIFYNLLFGSDKLQEIALEKDPKKYNYLALSDCDKVASINDAKDWSNVLRALETLGFKKEHTDVMWKVLAAILHLGNVNFGENPAEKPGAPNESMITNPEVVDVVSGLLENDPGLVRKALTSRTIVSGNTGGGTRRGSVINVPIDKDGAIFTRDALAKAVYEKLFNWIVSYLNATLDDHKAREKYVIGVLDIYGFEIFDNNSFEQFCINLCNEKLQQVFIELTLKQEQEEYIKEGIQWEPIDYFNNKIICELIEGDKAAPAKPSITALMDDKCQMAESTDELLLQSMDEKFATHAHYVSFKTSKAKDLSPTDFRLKHYAGDVTYNIKGFLDKNKDTLFNDLISAMNDSALPLLKEWFPPVDDSMRKKPVSASMRFKTDLSDLMAKLMETRAHYIRCIKPNDHKRANALDEERTRHQVRYLGLMENVRVRRAGFAYRRKYEHFVWRYKVSCPSLWPKEKPVPKDSSLDIMKHHGVPSGANDNEFRLGNTKIFIRNPEKLFLLESKRAAVVPLVLARAQATWRGWKVQHEYEKDKAALRVQSRWRAWVERRAWEKLHATALLQCRYRGNHQKNAWADQRASYLIQCRARQHLALEAHRDYKAALSLQAHMRAALAKDLYARIKATVLLQSRDRGYIAKVAWEKLRATFLLQRHLRDLMVRAYCHEVAKNYDGVAPGNFHLQKRCPKGPNMFRDVPPQIEKMHWTWKHHTVKKQITNDAQRKRIDMLIHVMDTFGGNKQWQVTPTVHGDVVGTDASPLAAKYQASIRALFAKCGDTKVEFSIKSFHLSAKLKAEPLLLVLTDGHVHYLDAKKGAPLKQPIELPLKEIKSITLTKGADHFLVLHANPPLEDTVVHLRADNGKERYSEFLQILFAALQKKSLPFPPIQFSNNVTLNNSRNAKKPAGLDLQVSLEAVADNPKISPGTVVAEKVKGSKTGVSLKANPSMPPAA